jgi:N-methylhydantoinase A
LRARGEATLAAEGVREEDMQFLASADVRYAGQSHELTVPFAAGGGGVDELRETFERAHEARYGHASPDEEAELVTLRLRARGPALAKMERCVARAPAGASIDRPHRVWFDPSGPLAGRVCSRDVLSPGSPIRGPLVVVGDDATILVPADASGRCDADGNIVLDVKRDG